MTKRIVTIRISEISDVISFELLCQIIIHSKHYYVDAILVYFTKLYPYYYLAIVYKDIIEVEHTSDVIL